MKKILPTDKKQLTRKILAITALRATLYAALIAFIANVADAIPFPYKNTIASWSNSSQTLFFFIAAFLIFFFLVGGVNLIRIRLGKLPLQSKKKRWF